MFQANPHSFAVTHLAKDGFWPYFRHAAYGPPQIAALKTLCESQLPVNWSDIWMMIYMDDLYCFMISMHLYFMPFHAPKKFGSSEAQLSGHKAASLCMESLNLPFDSIQICPSRTLQSKDGNHLVAVASGSYRIIQNPIRNHPDHTLTYLDLIWFDIFWW